MIPKTEKKRNITEGNLTVIIIFLDISRQFVISVNSITLSIYIDVNIFNLLVHNTTKSGSIEQRMLHFFSLKLKKQFLMNRTTARFAGADVELDLFVDNSRKQRISSDGI